MTGVPQICMVMKLRLPCPLLDVALARLLVTIMDEAKQTITRLGLYVDPDAQVLICGHAGCRCALSTTGSRVATNLHAVSIHTYQYSQWISLPSFVCRVIKNIVHKSDYIADPTKSVKCIRACRSLRSNRRTRLGIP